MKYTYNGIISKLIAASSRSHIKYRSNSLLTISSISFSSLYSHSERYFAPWIKKSPLSLENDKVSVRISGTIASLRAAVGTAACRMDGNISVRLPG